MVLEAWGMSDDLSVLLSAFFKAFELKCPGCGSSRLIKWGRYWYYNRRGQRYRCKACGKTFHRQQLPTIVNNR